MKCYLLPIAIILIALVSCKDDGEEEPVEEKPIKTMEEVFCNNECVFAKDGSCDDGGPGSLFDYCDLGTDCADCDERVVITVQE